MELIMALFYLLKSCFITLLTRCATPRVMAAVLASVKE